LREAKIYPHPAAVLLALAVPLCSHRMPLHKARKRIFRGAFVRECGKEKSDKLLEASFKNRLFMSEFSMSG